MTIMHITLLIACSPIMHVSHIPSNLRLSVTALVYCTTGTHSTYPLALNQMSLIPASMESYGRCRRGYCTCQRSPRSSINTPLPSSTHFLSIAHITLSLSTIQTALDTPPCPTPQPPQPIPQHAQAEPLHQSNINHVLATSSDTHHITFPRSQRAAWHLEPNIVASMFLAAVEIKIVR